MMGCRSEVKSMVYGEREITREQYERAISNYGFIADVDLHDVFTESEIYGYGIYYARAYIGVNGKYICSYSRGSSCD